MSLDTKTASELWNCTVDDVTAWCRDGFIPNAYKKAGRGFIKKWVIPDDSKRPVDRHLQKELLWRILQKKNDQAVRIDLSIWGISEDELNGYIATLLPLLLRIASADGSVRSLSDIYVTEAGFKLIGYHHNGTSEEVEVPEVLTWTASWAGTFAASFAKEMLGSLPGAVNTSY